jgi:transcriptional regulator with XRE-family HTH domain
LAQTSFGNYIQVRRRAAHLSLRQVAGKIGVSHVYLSEVERGVRAPLKRERWNDLVAAIPNVTIEELDKAAATSRPIQLSLADAPPQYQNLALALARRFEDRSLSGQEIQALLRILEAP